MKQVGLGLVGMEERSQGHKAVGPGGGSRENALRARRSSNPRATCRFTSFFHVPWEPTAPNVFAPCPADHDGPAGR